ncbi:MAG: alpha-galactosidase [Eubacteriales bacterium]|nr:alpha-galactosidase [Eubacteriales bacterium]
MQDLSSCGVTLYNDRLERMFGPRCVVWYWPQFPLAMGTVQHWMHVHTVQTPWQDGLEADALYQDQLNGAQLTVRLRVKPNSPFLRLRYRLTGETAFMGTDGENPILYGSIRVSCQSVTEVQLSQFERLLHSYLPSVEQYPRETCAEKSFIGPIMLLSEADACVLLAYEHGAQVPDHFLTFRLAGDKLCLFSRKGNYVSGQKAIDYQAPWLQIGLADTAGAMFRAYRRFMLCDIAENPESRKPYIFYNTWHFQEGGKYFQGNSVLGNLKEDYILRDIDTARRLGVEVYVLDTGWFQKTGDWEVNEAEFPNRMKAVRDRLQAYGMKLGLWLNPVVAAKTSAMYREHPEYAMKRHGQVDDWGKIWETEESCGMCLASGYSDLLIERLISLYENLGVRYFKWDAVAQYGCDAPGHLHGSENNSPEERADAYAYRMGLEMIRVAEAVTARCPEAIVDFDITEGGRFVGLGFLSVGKFFLMNNGPYFSDLDIPKSVRIQPDTINAFFYPGPARAQVCRQSAQFDFLIPSVLFLTHFLPHGSPLSQRNNMAALVLGGNGVWGFLEELTEADIARWHTLLNHYKAVRYDVTGAYPVRRGIQGGSPEIYEKINSESGRGCVVFFTHAKGTYEYVTSPLPRMPDAVYGCEQWRVLESGALRFVVSLDTDDAQVVFIT